MDASPVELQWYCTVVCIFISLSIGDVEFPYLILYTPTHTLNLNMYFRFTWSL